MATIHVRDSHLVRNGSYGIYLVQSGGTIVNSVFDRNEGALTCDQGSGPVIQNCSFHRNFSAVVRLMNGSSPTIRNSIFAAGTDVAVFREDSASQPDLIHCIFFDSQIADFVDTTLASSYKGADEINALTIIGVVQGNLDGDPKLVLDSDRETTGTWTDFPSEVPPLGTFILTDANAPFVPGALVGRLIYTAVEDGPGLIIANTAQTVTVRMDSSFVGPGGEYRIVDLDILPGSSAIDTGAPAGAPAANIAGRTRPIGVAFDIGAYEFVGLSGRVVIDVQPAMASWSLRFWDGSTQQGQGAAMLDGVPAGPVVVTWLPLPGYVTPDAQQQTLVQGGIVHFQQVYVPNPTADPAGNQAARVLRYLLGLDSDPAGLDLNLDGRVDVGDLVDAVSGGTP
jgi:hypothetical protein